MCGELHGPSVVDVVAFSSCFGSLFFSIMRFFFVFCFCLFLVLLLLFPYDRFGWIDLFFTLLWPFKNCTCALLPNQL